MKKPSINSSTSSVKSLFDVIKGKQKKLLLTCEHASNQNGGSLFDRNSIPSAILNSHWAYDPGAKNLTNLLLTELKCSGILCNVSRLYCDVNRPLTSDTLFRRFCDDVEIVMNRNDDRSNRVSKVWVPYYLTAGQLANETQAQLITSIHSFNPIYENKTREHVEIGVLSSLNNEELAERVIRKLEASFPKVKLNEPWSGKFGLMYAADQIALGQGNGCKSLMVEVRNDLLENDAYVAKFVETFSKILLEEIQ